MTTSWTIYAVSKHMQIKEVAVLSPSEAKTADDAARYYCTVRHTAKSLYEDAGFLWVFAHRGDEFSKLHNLYMMIYGPDRVR